MYVITYFLKYNITNYQKKLSLMGRLERLRWHMARLPAVRSAFRPSRRVFFCQGKLRHFTNEQHLYI